MVFDQRPVCHQEVFVSGLFKMRITIEEIEVQFRVFFKIFPINLFLSSRVIFFHQIFGLIGLNK